MKVECVDYRKLPGQHPLFTHYLYDYESVDSFYDDPICLDLDSLKRRADSVLDHPPLFPRDQLVEMMRTLNQKMGAGEETFRNLEKLKSSRAVAVVTGQQTGFLGGPAFTMYKALTAIRLAHILNEEDYAAVPVFWLASDDSDFQEVHSTSFFGEDDELFAVRYPDLESDRSRMAGTVPLGNVEECLKYLQTRGPKGEFQKEVLDLLRETYHPAKNFCEGLGSWLSRLFEPYGLVLFDPLTPGYKRDLKSLFQVAVSQRREIVQALTKRADLLREKGFSPQVRVLDSESLIFWTEGDKRYKLEYRGKGGYEKKTDLSVILRDVAESYPRRGMMILISDLFTDRDGLFQGIQLLRKRGHDVMVFHIMDDDELDFQFSGPMRFEGLELPQHVNCNPRALREGYLEAVGEFRDEVRRRCTLNGADYALIRTSDPLDAALATYLSNRLGMHHRN
ncbi:MAG: bacillithiol biosynthesis BshC [Acidobacteria bacterium]|nr:bacillithiol biosynthesis BshC [Acidobacteriota bacterium]